MSRHLAQPTGTYVPGDSVESYDTAMTRGEYEALIDGQAEIDLDTFVEPAEETEFLDHQCRVKATLQLILSHRTEWERRLQEQRREVGLECDSEWLDALDEARAQL